MKVTRLERIKSELRYKSYDFLNNLVIKHKTKLMLFL
jgi:hypothetical protein